MHASLETLETKVMWRILILFTKGKKNIRKERKRGGVVPPPYFGEFYFGMSREGRQKTRDESWSCAETGSRARQMP